MRPKPPFDDPFIAGWTDDNVRQHFAFDSLPPESRHRYVPLGPFSIVREVRRGVPGFVVTDMRDRGGRLRVKTKRAATRIAKLIEDDCYG